MTELSPDIPADDLPPNAQTFGAEGIVGSMRGERFMAQLMMPVPVVMAVIGLVLMFAGSENNATTNTVRSTADYLAIALGCLVGGGMIYALFRMAYKMYKSADNLLAKAEHYKHRVLVVSDEGLDIFTAAFEEHARLRYSAAGILVVRVPWEAIDKFCVKMIKYDKSPRVRCYVIEGRTLPKTLDNRLLVTAKHFEPVEAELFTALEQRLPGRIEKQA